MELLEIVMSTSKDINDSLSLLTMHCQPLKMMRKSKSKTNVENFEQDGSELLAKFFTQKNEIKNHKL